MTLEQWERRTEWPLTALSLIFFALYAWQILAQPDGVWNKAADWTMNGMWAMFAADYLIGLVLAKDRWTYAKGHVLDLAVCILPMIRPLRLLRVLTALNALSTAALFSLPMPPRLGILPARYHSRQTEKHVENAAIAGKTASEKGSRYIAGNPYCGQGG
ncbi:MAG: hypothetical protein LKF99_06580 [Bifidobacterium sp.]|jgi:hypothetical protein|nr:hypothetical protein [Bifidobacterium sp.]